MNVRVFESAPTEVGGGRSLPLSPVANGGQVTVGAPTPAAGGGRLFVGHLASTAAGVPAARLAGLAEEGFVVTAGGLPAGCVALAGGEGSRGPQSHS
jgi:hypothetical protein